MLMFTVFLRRGVEYEVFSKLAGHRLFPGISTSVHRDVASASLATWSADAPCLSTLPLPLAFPPVPAPCQYQKVCIKSNVPLKQLGEIMVCIWKSRRLYFCIGSMEGVLKSHQLSF